MKNLLNIFIKDFGFGSLSELYKSSFGLALKKPVLLFSLSLASLGSMCEDFIGLDPLVYSSFIILLFLEFFTGIKASIKEGVKLQSKRFGRVILKLMIYTIIIGIINIFSTRIEVPKAFGFSVNIYSLIYYAVLNLIIIQLILSVFENLSRLGFEETNKIYKAISKLLKKYLDLKQEE
jgi:hypothetical protein